MRLWRLLFVILAAGIFIPNARAQNEAATVLIPQGQYTPFFIQSPGKGIIPETAKPVNVKSFELDFIPVSKKHFLDFVRLHKEWQKSSVTSLFADEHYLADWPDDLSFGLTDQAEEPVTNISWFAAEAFCDARDMRLPTTDEWEYALAYQGRNADAINKIWLQWLAKPNPSTQLKIGKSQPNGFGIYDLVGLNWEWTDDFDSFVSGSELRASDGKNGAAFCGAGGIGVKDTGDYPAFMRFSMRASLKASYTVKNLGFRCARSP